MNIFLHELDQRIHLFMETEESFRYVRYADDIIFSIKKGADSGKGYNRFRAFFQKALEDIKLGETSIELIRGIPRKTRILGLVVSIGPTGTLETRAPLKRWKRKLTIEHIMAKMEKEKGKKLSTFLRTLLALIKTRLAFAFSCSYQYNEQEIIIYFQNLIRARRVCQSEKKKGASPWKATSKHIEQTAFLSKNV